MFRNSKLPIPRPFQQLLAAVLIALMASPAWSQNQVAGTVLTSQSATMGNAPLPSGSTIFSGESVAVDQTGGAEINVAGGGRIELFRDSSVQLNRIASRVQFAVLQGGVSFLETALGDATIRAKDPSSVGVLHRENPDSAVLFTRKGTLTIKTAHDAKSVDVPEGSAVSITLADPPPEPQGGSEPAGRAVPALKKLAIILFIFAAAFLGVFLWIATHEPTETPSQLASEISPFKVQ
jgi:hypothetical protein